MSWRAYWVLMLGVLGGTVSTVASAKMFFVALSGDDVNSGQAWSTPFRSIQRALYCAQPGDSIIIRAGHYYESIQSVRSGQADARITLQAMPGMVLHGDDSHHRIVQIKHSFITLVGLSIDGQHADADELSAFHDKLIYIDGGKKGVTGLVLANLTLSNAYGECVRFKGHAQGNELAYSTIQTCGLRDFRYGRQRKNGEAVYIGTAPEQRQYPGLDASNLNWIHHNVMVTRGSECVDIKEGSAYNLIEHNVCRYNYDQNSGGLSVRGNHNTLRYNTVIHGRGAGIRLGGDSATDGINNQVRHNHLEDNRAGALKIMNSPQKILCGNILIHQAKTKVIRYGPQIKQAILSTCETP